MRELFLKAGGEGGWGRGGGHGSSPNGCMAYKLSKNLRRKDSRRQRGYKRRIKASN